ncbi:hypothetical protein CgunFtcFv8_009203 [Champsocephalus gunnari]|uniref:Dynein heavy chain C-terminal domain-containing protein n=1 Tax=Champsocephalus gunnari TaxID=52237 RepID=A0AAN8C0Y1_CHAGU|nr:hypothetical protein CgunFtcFv8_009203 [Champsocephalus gunnari]
MNIPKICCLASSVQYLNFHTGDMENLQNAVFLDIVPDGWTKQAYPSMCGLALWFSDLLLRIKELEA